MFFCFCVFVLDFKCRRFVCLIKLVEYKSYLWINVEGSMLVSILHFFSTDFILMNCGFTFQLEIINK